MRMQAQLTFQKADCRELPLGSSVPIGVAAARDRRIGPKSTDVQRRRTISAPRAGVTFRVTCLNCLDKRLQNSWL
jgi:hypothetical protein